MYMRRESYLVGGKVMKATRVAKKGVLEC
jgi:hypothetical protein